MYFQNADNGDIVQSFTFSTLMCKAAEKHAHIHSAQL